MRESSLTIRLEGGQREALRRTARALKKTESAFVRDLLARDLDSRSLGERVAHLAGSVDSSKAAGTSNPHRAKIRERNVRG